MTTDEHYKRVREIFDRVLELPTSEREVFLQRSCGEDEDLLTEVRALLHADSEAEGFLDESVLGRDSIIDSMVGAAVGGYRVEELISAGGMGVVYRARQEHPDRAVALKLIRRRAVTSHMLRRFELEAEVLGRLDHPGIAQIFEASTTRTDDGVMPFFAMELVHGPPLHRFATEQSLDLRARVELLAKVCDAVHHAHQNGVIHRDLKPANILVRSDGQPKVLDFGVARITDADVEATTLLTDSGLIVGTLSYMSPEQVRGSHGELDIRTDVYALGVIGYELLADRLPLDLAGRTVTEAALAIENETPRPLASAGGSFPADIQTIIGACLEKDKEQRYASAAELAADLRRFLADEPIVARPPSVLYQLGKFARRNRALAAASALALAALVVGLVVSIAGWNAAAQARARAEIEAAKATQLNTYLTEILQAPDPWADGKDVKVVDLLTRAAETIDESLAGQPEVAVLAHHRLGYTFMNLGQYDDAETQIRRALSLAEEEQGFSSNIEIDMLADLGTVLVFNGEFDEAETVLSDAFATAAAELDETDPSRSKSVHQLAMLRWEQGDLEQAEVLFRRCLDLSVKAHGADHKETIITVGALGNVLRQNEKLDEAEPLLKRALEWNLEHYGPDHPSTAIVVNNLAFVHQRLEQHEQALELFQESMATRRRQHDHDSISVLIGLNNLGLQLNMMGRSEEALPPLEEALGIADRIFPSDDWHEPALRSTYGRILLAAGRHDEAERELLASFNGQRAILGDDHWRTHAACSGLVDLYRTTGDAEREAHYRSLLPAEANEDS